MGKVIRFKTVQIEKNSGLGNAMSKALEHCSFDLVARMDSDDISIRNRFELQLDAFRVCPKADIIGGYITEFVGVPENIIGVRTVELDDAGIKLDMRKRCAMNHVCVMFRKQSVIDAGDYQDWYSNEDYYLWIRMIQNGCIFANVPHVLVNVRTGDKMSARRGGWKYFKSEQRIQKYMLDIGMITLPRYIHNVLVRFAGEILAPGRVRNLMYRLIRKRAENYREKSKTVMGNDAVIQHVPFSVIIAVYAKDDPEWFDTAMASIIDQTVAPDEIVLVIDGPVPDEIKNVIRKYEAVCDGM